MSYDAAWFDFDGVLADTEPLHFEAWRDTLAPAGIKLTWELYVSRCIGLADKEMVEMLGLLANPPKPIDELWPLYPLKKQKFQSLTFSAALISRETLCALKSIENYKLAVVTSSARNEIEPILIREGVMPLLGAAVYGDEVRRLKPDPEPYRTACERLAAKNALVFEDSDAGLASGRAAGCDVIRVVRPSELPDLIAQHLGS